MNGVPLRGGDMIRVSESECVCSTPSGSQRCPEGDAGPPRQGRTPRLVRTVSRAAAGRHPARNRSSGRPPGEQRVSSLGTGRCRSPLCLRHSARHAAGVQGAHHKRLFQENTAQSLTRIHGRKQVLQGEWFPLQRLSAPRACSKEGGRDDISASSRPRDVQMF